MTTKAQALASIEALMIELKAAGASPLYAPDLDVLTAITIHGGNRPGSAATDLSRHLGGGQPVSAHQAAEIKSAFDAYAQMEDPPSDIVDAMNALGGEATHRWAARIVNDWRIKSDEIPDLESTGGDNPGETKAAVRTRAGALRYNAPIGTPLKRKLARIKVRNSQPSIRVTGGWVRSGFTVPAGGGFGAL